MSATLTTYGRQLLLQATFMPEDYVPPEALWVAYTIEVPVPNSDGTQLVEPVPWSSYTRAAYGTLSHDYWEWSGFAEVYNIQQVIFPDATGGVDWGLLVGWALVDTPYASEGSNALIVGTVPEPFQVVDGDAGPVIDIGQLAVGLYD